MAGEEDDPRATELKEKKEAEEKTSPAGKVVYTSIKNEGESELTRKNGALAWSGLAAGLSMGFSFLVEGIIRDHLPETDWRPLLVKFGYSFGFLIIVLGRQQLFTENTLTVVLPFLARKRTSTLINIARLWTIVLLANLAGAFAFGLTTARTTAVDPALRETLTQIAHESMQHDFVTMVVRGIFAGWLIALMVWLLPFAETSRVAVVILITYLIGIGDFPHVIAGSVGVFHLIATGGVGLAAGLTGYTLPALIGNVLGGVTLVALLGHVQFAEEGARIDA